MMLNNETIRKAVKLWLEDKESAIAEYGHISDWDTSEVTDMSKLFFDANDFNEPIENWDTSNVTDMSAMFDNAFTFNQPLDKWDTSQVTDMTSMFEMASSFNQPLDNWDVSSVDSFVAMFSRATSFNQPLNMWEIDYFASTDSMFHCADSFNKDWASISTPKFKKKIKILKSRHELHPHSEYTDIIFMKIEVDSKVESIMVEIADEGNDGWYFYHGGEYTAKSDAKEWNEEMPEELKALPDKLLDVLFDMVYEIEIEKWPDSLIGMVVE